MNITFREAGIVCVYKEIIETDSLNRKEIKEILKEGYDEAPRYIEIPGPVTIAVFDYFNNPLFPVQLNFQKNKQLFIINGTADLDISKNKVLKSFARKYKQLEDSGCNPKLQKKAFGFNFLITLQAEEGEKIFDDFSNKEFNLLLKDMGELVAKGFRVIRLDKKARQRVDFKIEPVVPEIGKAFTYAYSVHVNIHYQPVKPELLASVESKILELKKMVLNKIKNI